MNLHLLQLGDSALPIGGYSHSWGLEAAVERGLVRTPAALEASVRHWLRDTAGPLEGVVVAASCAAAHQADWRALAVANQRLAVALSVPTLRHASGEMGEQLLALAESWPWAAVVAAALRNHTLDAPLGPWHHAPVFGALAAAAGATAAEALAVYLHQIAIGCIGAGVRAIPVGHTHGQQILARLHDEVGSMVAALVVRPLEMAGSFSPAYEVLCHAQAHLYTRLFRS